MDIIIFDPAETRDNLLPLTYTRPVGDLRIGIYTFAERWAKYINGNYSWHTADYLAEKYPCDADPGSPDSLMIAGNIVADNAIADAITALKPGEWLYSNDTPIAGRGSETTRTQYTGDITSIEKLYDIFTLNDRVLRSDIAIARAGRATAPLSSTCTLIGPASDLFIEQGATVEGCTINTAKGPVYIGREAEVMEGSTMRGPIAVCDHATVNMGARIYGATTVGPWCKVGGELNNVVMHSYSNKAHDGFLGNAVIGSWCNIGAGCNASNLKNDYLEIKLWNYPAHRFLKTGLQFCGLIMGDHSKAGINTMFNTATVVGVAVNIHGSGFPRNFIASFSNGGAQGFENVSIKEFARTAERVMARRGMLFTDIDMRIFSAIHDMAESHKW